MGLSMDFWNIFFSYRGRIDRGAYFSCNAAISFVNVITQSVVGISTGPLAVILSVGFGLLSLFLFWPSTAVMVKRGHDRNRPAWFSIIVFATAVTMLFVWEFAKTPITLGVAIVLVIYQFVDYLCLPASPKAKRYDLRPTGAGAAEAFS